MPRSPSSSSLADLFLFPVFLMHTVALVLSNSCSSSCVNNGTCGLLMSPSNCICILPSLIAVLYIWYPCKNSLMRQNIKAILTSGWDQFSMEKAKSMQHCMLLLMLSSLPSSLLSGDVHSCPYCSCFCLQQQWLHPSRIDNRERIKLRMWFVPVKCPIIDLAADKSPPPPTSMSSHHDQRKLPLYLSAMFRGRHSASSSGPVAGSWLS